jgi:DNA-binding HxlR family transcriptional regulator
VWKNNAYRLTERNRIMVAIVLRKEAKDKLHVMNEFRKNIQNLEKKALHQILSDLNNKMERINEKST